MPNCTSTPVASKITPSVIKERLDNYRFDEALGVHQPLRGKPVHVLDAYHAGEITEADLLLYLRHTGKYFADRDAIEFFLTSFAESGRMDVALRILEVHYSHASVVKNEKLRRHVAKNIDSYRHRSFNMELFVEYIPYDDAESLNHLVTHTDPEVRVGAAQRGPAWVAAVLLQDSDINVAKNAAENLALIDPLSLIDRMVYGQTTLDVWHRARSAAKAWEQLRDPRRYDRTRIHSWLPQTDRFDLVRSELDPCTMQDLHHQYADQMTASANLMMQSWHESHSRGEPADDQLVDVIRAVLHRTDVAKADLLMTNLHKVAGLEIQLAGQQVAQIKSKRVMLTKSSTSAPARI